MKLIFYFLRKISKNKMSFPTSFNKEACDNMYNHYKNEVTHFEDKLIGHYFWFAMNNFGEGNCQFVFNHDFNNPEYLKSVKEFFDNDKNNYALFERNIKNPTFQEYLRRKLLKMLENMKK